MDDRFDRIGLAVHPRRELDSALATVRDWAGRQEAEVVQIASHEREVAPHGEVKTCDLVIADGGDLHAINDLVLVRAGAGQVTIDIEVDGERFVRFAGDGIVAGTPLGSTAYTLASGGPMIAPGGTGAVLTPLSPHGGVCPPLVAGTDTPLAIMLDPGHGGARVEVDGQVRDVLERLEPVAFDLRLRPGFATLV